MGDARQRMSRRPIRTTLTYLALALVACLFLFPFLVMVGGSFGTSSIQVVDPFRWIPRDPTLVNYVTVFKQSLAFRWFLNSVIITLVPMATTLVISSAVGFIFAKKRFVGKEILFWGFMAVLMIPPQLTLIPRYILYSRLGWIDTYWSFLIPGAWSVMYMFLMRQFISAIPNALLDAADIDGCNDFKMFRLIVLPLSRSALATVATFTFINKWNDFVNPLIFTSDESMYNMIVGLASLLQQRVYLSFGVQMAGTIVTFIPILIVFLFFQKYFTRGIVLSGVKG
jgi:multiple sugar transport system permease protein